MSSDRLSTLLEEYAELERRLADPAVHARAASTALPAIMTPSGVRSSGEFTGWRRR